MPSTLIARDLLGRRPIRDQRAAVEHVAAAVGRARERPRARSGRRPRSRRRAARAARCRWYGARGSGPASPRATSRCARWPPMKPLAPVTRQTSSRERSTGAPRNGASATTRSFRVARRESVEVAISRTTDQFFPALAVGEHGVERVEEPGHVGFGQRQRRQQLDHVVLAGCHRDHAVVAVQRDHHQLREQAPARQMDQPPVEPRDPRARRAELDPDHQPAAADLLDQLVAGWSVQAVGEQRAGRGGVLDQAVALDHPQRGEARPPSTAGCGHRSTGGRSSARACRRRAGRSRGVVTIAATGM